MDADTMLDCAETAERTRAGRHSMTRFEEILTTAVSALDEQKKLEHQIELATRAASLVRDETTGHRFRNFADELRRKLRRLMRRGYVRARAYELWERAGRPADRELEFWLEAERQIEAERDDRRSAGPTGS